MSAQRRWMPDGWDASLRIGVLTPHAEVGPESELRVMAPDGVAVTPRGCRSARWRRDRGTPCACLAASASHQ